MTVYMFVDYFDLYVNCEVFRSHSKMLDVNHVAKNLKTYVLVIMRTH